jgi:DNA invertase Pin-like site-specific DNA recombinase
MNKETAVIYARVSTEDQGYDRQIIELKAYAKALNFDVVAIAAEKLSGAKQAVDRPELDTLLQKVRAEEVKHILVWDLSRLSRNVADTLAIVEVLNQNCCCLHIKDLNIKTKLDLNKKKAAVVTHGKHIIVEIV